MTGRTIRYGIIGCGMMGREHIRNIELVPQTSVGAILEPDAGMLAEALKLAPEARPAESIRALLADPAIDCVLIASPNFCHTAQLEEVAAIRPLPVLVEKPLFTDAADAGRIARLKPLVPLTWVAMEYRYMPAVAKFVADTAHATGGVRMLSIREHRYPFLQKVGDWNRFNRKTGGTFVEKGCHFFDLMRLILGANPVRVMASGGQAANHVDERYAEGTPDVWDHG